MAKEYFVITSERDNFDVTRCETYEDAENILNEFEESFDCINFASIIYGEIIK